MLRQKHMLTLLIATLLLHINFASNISTVYIVFSNHFDAGYTINNNGSTTGAVINEYFHKHFPAAIKTANKARTTPHPYKWMTQSWLIDLYLNCNATKINTLGPQYPSDLICPNKTSVANLKAAIHRGDINWHALPFNAEPELFTTELFQAALNMTFRQDDAFNKSHRLTLSQRDVPGMTRAVIPILVKNGVQAVSVGENSQCAPSAVPPIFLWKDNTTNTEVIGLFHALGYGGSWPAASYKKDIDTNIYTDSIGASVLNASEALYNHDDGPGIHIMNGKVYGNSSRSEACVSVNQAGVALCYAWKVDNSGPHTLFESNLIFDVVSDLFPSVKKHNIVASNNFDDFITDVFPYKHTLPIVTEEIGDTWIMGASADPLKIALFRSAMRLHQNCTLHHDCLKKANNNITAYRAFERLLTLTGEHTWGWNGGSIKSKSWKNVELQTSLKNDQEFVTAVVGWQEQRSHLRNALSSLPVESELFAEINQEWDKIEGKSTKMEFNTTGMKEIGVDVNTICGDYNIMIGQDGAIVGLSNIHSKQIYANVNHTLAKLYYQGMDSHYFKIYVNQYVAGISDVWPELTAAGLYKPNLNEKEISSNGTVIYVKSNEQNRIVIEINFSKASHEERGAPIKAQIEHVCKTNGESGMSSTIRWYNKTATHVPETIWLSNVPMNVNKMEMDKMGMVINALEVDLKCDGMNHLTCGVHLHGVGDGGVLVTSMKTTSNSSEESTLGGNSSSMRLISWDSALVSIGGVDPVPTPLVVPDVTGGVHFALVGNIWNTNYPFWYPFDSSDMVSQFRFTWEFL